MTIEELLKPRWILLIDYPGNDDNIGTVFSSKILANDRNNMYDPHHYPQIFKPLEWWEHRDQKDLPKYVKSIATQRIYETSLYLIEDKVASTGVHYIALQTTIPSTEEEFIIQNKA